MFPTIHTLAFEAPEGAEPPVGGGEGFDDDFGGEGVSEEWSGPSQEDWEAMQDSFQQLNELISAAQAEMQGGGQQPAYDPDQPLTMGELQAYLEQRDQEVLGPVYQDYESRQMDEAEQRAMDIIADIESREGEFLNSELSRQIARERANYYLDEAEARYGRGPKAAEAALTRAYKEVKEYENAVGNAYHERRSNEARGLRQAPQPPRAANREVGPGQPERTGDITDLVREFLPMSDGS